MCDTTCTDYLCNGNLYQCEHVTLCLSLRLSDKWGQRFFFLKTGPAAAIKQAAM